MSNLFEEAIVDATALREAAIKNAENTLIEKYSEEFKNTVEKLLEQEVATAAPATQDVAAVAPPTDAAKQIASADQLATAVDASEQEPGGIALKNVPSSFLDGDEDEVITINFDQLKKTMLEMFGHEETLVEVDTASRGETVNVDALAPNAPLEEESEELELELEEGWDELESESMELDELESTNVGEYVEALEEQTPEVASATANLTSVQADADKRVETARRKLSQAQQQAAQQEEEAAKAAKAAEATATVSEEFDITEEEISELAEQLAVDIAPERQNRGYMGTTNTEKQLQKNAERAAARDDKATEEREEELKKMQDLVNENANLKAFNDKMMATLEALKEQVEKINISNAKLLYTNKALGNISLNERQKNTIVESISKADSVLAAKTIYETLQNAVENTPKEKEAPQSLREALNRAQSPFVVKKTSANSISDVMAERMKALAGIKPTK